MCGWARFRRDLLACWLGVLSAVSQWELDVGVGHCSFQQLTPPVFLSVSHMHGIHIRPYGVYICARFYSTHQ